MGYNYPMRAQRWALWVTAAVALAWGWKAFWLGNQAFPFHADEAVVGLMARHILAGERPTFFYGQAYMGSLDAFLVAGGFALAGVHVWVIRAVQALLYGGTIALSALLAREVWGDGRAAIATALLLAVPTVNMTLYTTVSLGGYGEALLIGTALLLLALSRWGERPLGAALWGLLAGLGLWAFGLTLVYAASAGLYLLWRWRRKGRRQTFALLGAAVVGGVIGAAPWWLYGLHHGWVALVRELTGSAIAVEGGAWPARILRHTVYFLLLGLPVTLGLRPPWDVGLLVGPLAVLVAAVYAWGAMALWQVRRHLSATAWPLLGVALAVVGGFVFTSFGADPSGRYFLPLTQMAAVGLGGWLARLRWRGRAVGWAVLGLLILFHAASTAQAAANPYRLTTQFAPDARVHPDANARLAAFLAAHGETRGYTTYWAAYPLAFLSDERLIFVPRLPYHEDLRYTPRDDRYPPYDALVAAAPRVAYATLHRPPLEACLRRAFAVHGLTWQEATVSDYRVFYALSVPLAPETFLPACKEQTHGE